MRILAIDHGKRRIGVAISDSMRLIAQPLEYVEAEPFGKCLARLKALVEEREVSLVLVGMPWNMDGSYGPAAEKATEFVKRLGKEVSVPIKTWDERFTTVEANRYLTEAKVRGKKRREKVDQMAAAILLQSYLDSLDTQAGL